MYAVIVKQMTWILFFPILKRKTLFRNCNKIAGFSEEALKKLCTKRFSLNLLNFLLKIKTSSQNFHRVIIRFKFGNVPCDFSALKSAHGIKFCGKVLLIPYYLRRETRWPEKNPNIRKFWWILELFLWPTKVASNENHR